MEHYDAIDKANKIAHDSLEFYRQAVKRSEAEERAKSNSNATANRDNCVVVRPGKLSDRKS